MAGNHGGKREGAGRKKGYVALASEKMRERVMKQMEDDYELLWGPQFEKAKAGDTNAFKEIREFAAGKPRQNVGLDGGEDGVPMQTMELTDEQYKRIILERAGKLSG